MQTIDDIIKKAVEEASLKPVNNGTKPEVVKSAGDGAVADKLYKLADELERMGDVPIGGVAEKKAGDDTLRQLAKTYIYQQTLKHASEDRMEVADDTDTEKLAAHVEANAAYLDAFEKKAGLGSLAKRYRLHRTDRIMARNAEKLEKLYDPRGKPLLKAYSSPAGHKKWVKAVKRLEQQNIAALNLTPKRKNL